MTSPEVASPEVVSPEVTGNDFIGTFGVYSENFWEFPIEHSIFPAEISTGENLGIRPMKCHNPSFN
jgi:hypothetical protein